MAANPRQFLSVEDYLALDLSSDIRYEYWNDEAFATSGASPEHEEIIINLATELRGKIGERGCRVYSSNLRVKVPAAPPYKYPDITALCSEPEYEELGDVRMLVNPALIVEVLSPTTAAFDRGGKFTVYKSIANFREYLLVDQATMHVVLYVKQAENKWLQSEFLNPDDRFYLSSLACRVTVKDVYRGIEFDTPNR